MSIYISVEDYPWSEKFLSRDLSFIVANIDYLVVIACAYLNWGVSSSSWALFRNSTGLVSVVYLKILPHRYVSGITDGDKENLGVFIQTV